MKKWLSVLFACVMLFGAFAATVSAEVAQPVTYTVASVTANPGDTVQIPVSVSDNHYTVNARLFISYDPTLLELQEVSDDADCPYVSDWNTAILDASCMYALRLAAPGDIRFIYATSADQGAREGGTLFTLTFKVLSEVSIGAPVTLTVKEACANDGVTEGGYDFIPTLDAVSGGVTVEEATLIKGDLDMNGEVTITDALMLFQYINGTTALNETQKELAEVADPDTTLSINDALTLFQYVNGVSDAL